MLFCACDLDQMTFIYELDLGILWRYRPTCIYLLLQGFWKCVVLHTDTHVDRCHCNYYHTDTRVKISKPSLFFGPLCMFTRRVLSTAHEDIQWIYGLQYGCAEWHWKAKSTVSFTRLSVNELKMCKYVFFTGRRQTTLLHRHMHTHTHMCKEAKHVQTQTSGKKHWHGATV